MNKKTRKCYEGPPGGLGPPYHYMSYYLRLYNYFVFEIESNFDIDLKRGHPSVEKNDKG